jgi:hypothetical protein
VMDKVAAVGPTPRRGHSDKSLSARRDFSRARPTASDQSEACGRQAARLRAPPRLEALLALTRQK